MGKHAVPRRKPTPRMVEIIELIEAMRARFVDVFAELDNRLTIGEAPPAEWRTFR